MVRSYIALDLETTGLNPKLDKIIEIGAVRVIEGEEMAQFQTMVQPRCLLSGYTSELTGIRQEDVEGAPDVEEAVVSFLEFSQDLPLIGHNILFDYSFLKRAAVNQKLEFERSGVDTLKLCRRFMPPEGKKSLEAACAFFGIEREQAHRALSDAKDAHLLYETLSRDFGSADPGAFSEKPLIYKVKREQPASKKQKEGLRELAKYHKIDLPVQIDYLSRNEASRMIDRIIAQYGRMI